MRTSSRDDDAGRIPAGARRARLLTGVLAFLLAGTAWIYSNE
ncbi:MAG: hypothetical protein V7647_1509 [Acidobacteriota bacterium]